MLSQYHQRLPQSQSPHPHHFSTSPSPENLYYFSDDNNSSPVFNLSLAPTFPPSKRQKVFPSFDFSDTPSSYDCPPLVSPIAMPQAVSLPQNIAPHINVHRPSEPASPVTIATTLSTHSSPSSSPSRVTIVSDHSPTDFPLFEDNYSPKEHQLKQQQQQQQQRPRFNANTSNPSFPLGDMDHQTWPLYSSHMMDYTKLQRPQQQRPYFQHPMPTYNHTEDEDLPDLSPSRCSTSRPSIPEIEMPATPGHSPIHREGSRCAQAQPDQHHAGPKLVRTVSDAVQDELFNPGIAPGTTRSQPERITDTGSQLPTLFRQAQTQHAMAKAAMMARDHSPFRANSPFHPARTQQEIIPSPTRTTAFLNVGAYASVRSRREKDMEREAQALRDQMEREFEDSQQAPKTISPKDAYIEYREPEGNGIQGSLFSSSQNEAIYSSHQSVKSESDTSSYHDGDDDEMEQDYDSMVTDSRRESKSNMDYHSMPMYHSNGAQQQQQQQHQFDDHPNIHNYSYRWGDESSSQESSESSRHSDYDFGSSPLHKPDDTMANDAAYSCTVHGCHLRFPTASKMSKHRREAHRNPTPLGRGAPADKSLLQGPSRCARINPTTGKPCNTIFSRPYDLTRHEDTIHNLARQKVRCEICNDNKTFSRHDALTRHKKVKHGIDK